MHAATWWPDMQKSPFQLSHEWTSDSFTSLYVVSAVAAARGRFSVTSSQIDQSACQWSASVDRKRSSIQHRWHHHSAATPLKLWLNLLHQLTPCYELHYCWWFLKKSSHRVLHWTTCVALCVKISICISSNRCGLRLERQFETEDWSKAWIHLGCLDFFGCYYISSCYPSIASEQPEVRWRLANYVQIPNVYGWENRLLGAKAPVTAPRLGRSFCLSRSYDMRYKQCETFKMSFMPKLNCHPLLILHNVLLSIKLLVRCLEPYRSIIHVEK